MRDNLPIKPRRNEDAIVNLDVSSGPGTHWVAYKKRGNRVSYFDSFGNLGPPAELIKYFDKNVTITYNYDALQRFDQTNCGHLCVKFLHK